MKILIVGAGPAGSRLAFKLAKYNISVKLIDKLLDYSSNNFSSAVLPIDCLKDLDIPEECVSTYWNSWQIFNPNKEKFSWTSQQALGVVLDFAEFRRLLWERAMGIGVDVQNGCTANIVKFNPENVEVDLKFCNGDLQRASFDFVVDATGFSRSLIGKYQFNSKFTEESILKGFGLEWIIQPQKVDDELWKNNISFLLGTAWIKHGYGWVFPMSENMLKVGVCHLPPNSNFKCSNLNSNLKYLLDYFKLNNSKVIDKHASYLGSSLDRNETHYYQRLIGVGDTISTANLLGGEGIRHALISADVLAPLLIELSEKPKLEKLLPSFILDKYKDLLKSRFGWAWKISSRIARRTWWGLSDDMSDLHMTKLIENLAKKTSAEDISALLFDYKFERYGLRFLPYLLGFR